MITGTLLLAVLVQAAASTPVNLIERQTDCEDVHLFVARGSEEDYPGRQEVLVDAVCEGKSSCGYEDIIYPATFGNYCTSAFDGVTNGTAQITAYADNCPDAKLVLTGYSQGAQVLGDILGGGGGVNILCEQPTNTPLSPENSPGNKIVAATFFGDPRHTASQSYNVASGADKDGIWPRPESMLESLNRFADSLQSWCLIGDLFCALGNDSNAHTSYFDIYTDDAAAWINSKL
ncbi:carbohydrate esterase family 5 protein [Hypoxylon sp. FL1857]|nr:carbohydrate esterase family 5 protein [Hypoxylon sp. FL1857]